MQQKLIVFGSPLSKSVKIMNIFFHEGSIKFDLPFLYFTFRSRSYQTFFLRKRRIFSFFATKLGHCTVHTFFSYATNSQAYQQKSENRKNESLVRLTPGLFFYLSSVFHISDSKSLLPFYLENALKNTRKIRLSKICTTIFLSVIKIHLETNVFLRTQFDRSRTTRVLVM